MNNDYNNNAELENNINEVENNVNDELTQEKKDIEEQYRILKDEEEKEKKRREIILLILFILLLLVSLIGAIFNYASYKKCKNSEPCKTEKEEDTRKIYGINCDIDGDGIPDINIDYNADGKCDFNCDTNNNGRPDKNLMNHDTNNDGICDLNCDTDKDGYPDINIDLDGDGKPDINIDTDKDGNPDVNIDTDGDGKPDKNIDNDGDGKPDENITDKPCPPCKPDRPKPTTPTTPDKDDDNNGNEDNKEDPPKEENVEMYVLFSTSNKFEASNIVPGWKSSIPHEFFVKNTGDTAAIYDVEFNNITSTFANPENLRYTITCNDMVVVSNQPVPTTTKIVLKGEIVAVGETNTYKVYYSFVETGHNQDNDQGKTYSVAVDVKGRS